MSRMILSTLAFVMLSTSAIACDGFYMGLRAGITDHSIGETGATTSNRYEVEDNRLMVSGALGYRYGYFRAELEYVYRKEAEKVREFTSTGLRTTSYMLNGYYDLTPYSRFTPFISAGLGATKIEVEFQPLGGAEENDDKTNFTWSVGGGVSAKLTNRWNLDVGYRFYNMGKLEEASIRNHEIYGGARYIF